MQTFTSGFQALADWLVHEEVTRVVVEATGQYRKPVWYVLEENGFELLLARPDLGRGRVGAAPPRSAGLTVAAR